VNINNKTRTLLFLNRAADDSPTFEATCAAEECSLTYDKAAYRIPAIVANCTDAELVEELTAVRVMCHRLRSSRATRLWLVVLGEVPPAYGATDGARHRACKALVATLEAEVSSRIEGHAAALKLLRKAARGGK
jgi:hypothetical protein